MVLYHFFYHSYIKYFFAINRYIIAVSLNKLSTPPKIEEIHKLTFQNPINLCEKRKTLAKTAL